MANKMVNQRAANEELDFFKPHLGTCEQLEPSETPQSTFLEKIIPREASRGASSRRAAAAGCFPQTRKAKDQEPNAHIS